MPYTARELGAVKGEDQKQRVTKLLLHIFIFKPAGPRKEMVWNLLSD